MDTPPAKRFKILTDKELQEQQLSAQNLNTLKNEKKAERIFKEYLQEAGETDLNFYLYTEEQLDSHLAKFWFAARKKNHELYRVSSLENIRHSLNRALKRSGHGFDITKKECTSFTKSIKAFEDVITLLKKQGKGYVENTPDVIPSGINNVFCNTYIA